MKSMVKSAAVPFKETHNIQFLWDIRGFFLPAVRRGPDDSTIGSTTAVFNTEFDASIMFRMSYGDGLISLEALDGGTSMTHTYSPSPDNDVKYIKLYSKTKTPTQWTFYQPCDAFL